MGIRTLILLAAILAVIWLLRRSWRQMPRNSDTRKIQVGRMVRCAHCGLHLPAEEALYDEQQLSYCSQKHLDAGPGNETD